MAKRHDKKAMCLGKVRYGSYDDAREAVEANRRLFPDTEMQEPYACRFCGRVHVGTLSLKRAILRGLVTFPADAGEGREAHVLD